MNYKYIYLNNLYKRSKKQAIEQALTTELDLPLQYQFFNTSFLQDLGLWNTLITKQLTTYNTKRYYTSYSSLDVTYQCLDLINNLSNDTMLVLDYNLSLDVNFYNINLLPFIDQLSRGRTFTMQYINLIASYGKEHIIKYIKQNPKLLNYIIANDANFFCDSKLSNAINKFHNPELYLLSLPYKKWSINVSKISDKFICDFFYRFKLRDLLSIRSSKFVWNIIKNLPYTYRYAMYLELPQNDEVVKSVRQDLKNLVKSNYKNLVNKYNQCPADMISVISEIINQIVVFPILIDLVYMIMSELDDMSRDICMFYLLLYISEKPSYVVNSQFAKWYVNISRLLKLFYSKVDNKPLQDFVDLSLQNKVFSCVLLVEITSGSVFLTNRNAVFLYEDYDIKLKDDVFERYQYIANASQVNCNIKYMTCREADKLKITTFDYEYQDDYLYIRNVARVVSKNIDKIAMTDKIIDFFQKCCKNAKEDIKLIGNSMISKIAVLNRKI